MKKMKLLFLLLIPLMITGCSVDYNVLVDENKKVVETVKFIGVNEQISNNNESLDMYLNEQITTYKQIDLFSHYIFTKHVGKMASYVMMQKSYESLKEYSNSTVFRNIFEGAEVIKKEDYTSFNTTGKYYYNNLYGGEGTEPDFYINDLTIKIKFYNKVVDSNADKVDERNNTLEWDITPENIEKYIYFKVSNDKRYDIMVIDFIIRNKVTFISIFTVTVSILIILLYLHLNLKKNNKI